MESRNCKQYFYFSVKKLLHEKILSPLLIFVLQGSALMIDQGIIGN